MIKNIFSNLQTALPPGSQRMSDLQHNKAGNGEGETAKREKAEGESYLLGNA